VSVEFFKVLAVLAVTGTVGVNAYSATNHSARAPGEKHWAFIAPVLPSLPVVKNARWVRNPIDAFVLARLEREGIAPSAEADRATLLRRVYLDLIGLPPTLAQAQEFFTDRRPDAYERVVEELLASPHFGERWARHWLDLARYADTSGYQIDKPRPYAWLFRDWVIDSFNRDQPFDQFTIEQLAGDLLPGATSDQLVASGFHRLTLMNHEEGTDAEEFRCKAKVDRVNTTATTWLGLTMGCAECHNHKYDPISQRDYYQLYAFFNNAEEADVSAPKLDNKERFEKQKKEWGEQEARLKAAYNAAKTNAVEATRVKRQLNQHRRNQPRADTLAHSFRESTNVASASIHVRGDFLRTGEVVRAAGPAVLSRLTPRGSHADRLDLARWLVDPANPLTARVTVNHVWQHLFGRGLVATPNDFGTRGDAPSHPELLDWLAVAFHSGRRAEAQASPIDMAWSRKALIRLIVTSATYQQSSRARPELDTRDPLSTLLARQNRLRVEGEIVRDLHLAVAGLLNDDVGGPSFRPFMPDDIRGLGNAGAFSWENSSGDELHRRGLYIFSQRTVPYPTAMTFDQANSCESCPQRERSNTPLQALTLLNHGLFVECGTALGLRMAAVPLRAPREKIAAGFQLCLTREPSRAELNRLERLFREQTALASPTNAEAAFTQVAQVLLNLDEFMTRE
jgi:hypothetical protein